MVRFFRTRARAVAAATALIAALALPAAADAKRKFDGPPGGDDIVVVAGAPTVAYAAADGVHVSRATKAGNRWQQLGGTIRHAAGAPVFDVDLAVAPNGQPWVTWTETDSGGVRQARVARFDGRHWREVVGGDRPINEEFPPDLIFPALDPQLGFAGGRVWLTYIQFSMSDDVLDFRRLSSDGSRWEVLEHSTMTPRPSEPRIAAAGGRLFVGVTDVLGPGAILYGYNAGTDRFALLRPSPAGDDYSWLDDLSSLGDRLTVMFTRHRRASGVVEVQALGADGLQPVGAPLTTAGDGQDLEGRVAAWLEDGRVRVARLTMAGWRGVALPGDTSATFARLAAGRDVTWLLWRDAGGGTHVLRLVGA